MGYHRLWSHGAFKASAIVRLFLATAGLLAVQGSIKWWSMRHRLHHRFTDTDHDPYNAKRGFWFSHIGWIFYKQKYSKMSLIESKDLDNDWIVRLQHKYYIPFSLLFGFILPTLICALWKDSMGGFLICAHLSKVIIWHCTFCINSFAHWIGSQDYSIDHTARGNLLLAMVTHGEGTSNEFSITSFVGHHNFHHEFPKDYRNGWKWYHYDPTKWLIMAMNKIGLTWDLCISSPFDIKKAIIATKEVKVRRERSKYSWGPSIDSLPHFTKEDVENRIIKEGRCLIIMNGLVYDVSEFMGKHPGGRDILSKYNGINNAEIAFYGGLHKHSNAAQRKAAELVIAKFSSSKML